MPSEPNHNPRSAGLSREELEDLFIGRGGKPPAGEPLRPEDTEGLRREELEDLLISRGGTAAVSKP